jgi:hypothetical protein
MWRASVLALWLFAATPLAAQWSVSTEVGMLRFWGAAVDTAAPDDPSGARPSPSTSVSVRVQRRCGTIGLGIGVLHSSGGIGVEKKTIAVEEKDVVQLDEVLLDAALRVASPGPGGAVVLHLGPVIDRWSPVDVPRRTRIGARAAVSLDLPIGARWTGTFAAGVALSASLFLDDEVPEGFVLRAMWRRALSAGIQLRL